MQQLEHLFVQFRPGSIGQERTLQNMIIALLFAFAIGQLVAFVYHRTHSGLSYSRSFTQSIVLLVIISALVMFVIGSNIMAAFGLIGALTIIRFRNVLKDTRDTAFVFMSLVLGMAVGAGQHGTAMVGGSFLLLIAGWLSLTAFGTRERFDGHLSYNTAELAAEAMARIEHVVKAYCRRTESVVESVNYGAVEHVVHVRLRDRTRGGEMLEHLRQIEGVGEVCLVLRDDRVEL